VRIIALYLALAAIGVLILFLWNNRPWKASGKIAALVLALAIVGISSWVLWRLQPWMSPGSAVCLRSEGFGGYDFQVWQRKNAETFEPFADGLFVRSPGKQWRVLLLDFQDRYRPSFTLREASSGIIVLRNGETLGVFDRASQAFKWEPYGRLSTGDALDGEPPGNWWLKPETEASVPSKDKRDDR
jgi:hypothetical protein